MDEQGGATKTWRITIGVDGPGFDAREDQTLLLAAEAAGLPLASSCRNGTCRTCMRHMLSGEVRYRIEWPGLLVEEKREGWVLPCVAHPAADIVLD
jgi:ferredoxin